MNAEGSEVSLPDRPTLPFRIANSFQLGWVGTACRSFLLAFNRLEVNGWDKFQQLLDERADVGARTRGLITVSNHTSVYVRISLNDIYFDKHFPRLLSMYDTDALPEWMIRLSGAHCHTHITGRQRTFAGLLQVTILPFRAGELHLVFLLICKC